MTKEHEASRRLVKSPPELWAECSDPSSLARHLGEFGEIKITRVEPETTVAWEGEHARGTVRIEPSGWGTRVTLTALTEAPGPGVEEAIEAVDGEPVAEAIEAVDREPNVEATEAVDEVPGSDPIQEESDATAEKTLEEPHPAVAPEAPRLRTRWWRLRSRFRAALTGPQPQAAPSVAIPAADPDPEDVAREPEAVAEPAEAAGEPEAAAEPSATVEPEPPAEPSAAVEPSEPAAEPEAVPEPQHENGGTEVDLDPEAILVAALDSLGQAHHRPFSRA